MPNLQQIADLEKRFLLPTYNRYPVAFERGKGVFLFDFDGKKYLDFVAGLGVNALGHAQLLVRESGSAFKCVFKQGADDVPSFLVDFSRPVVPRGPCGASPAAL